jgi:hypothetical protein
MIEPKNMSDDELIVHHRDVVDEIKRRAARDLPEHNRKRKLCKGCVNNEIFTICPKLEVATLERGKLNCFKAIIYGC